MRVGGPWIRGRKPADDRLIEVVTGVFLMATGVAVLMVPVMLGRIAFVLIAMVWLIDGLATLMTSLRGTADSSTSMVPRLVDWIESRSSTVGDRAQLYDKLFYEGDAAQRRLSRFFMLMAFATVIEARRDVKG